MSLPSPTRRPSRPRAAVAVPGVLAAVLAGAVLTATPVSAAGKAPAPGDFVALDAAYLAANKVDDTKVKGDDGRRSFGVQPAGPKKPDARPNLTYRGVKPGQRLFDHVAIVNISNFPVTLSIYPADAFNTKDGGFDVLRQGQKSTDLGSWVKLKRNTVTVPARSAFITPIELTVPKNAEPGDHAAAIIASLRSRVKDSKGNVVNRDDRVGTRLYVRVAGKLSPKLELERRAAAFDAENLFKGKATVTYTLRNTGNVRLTANQSLRVSGLFGTSSSAPDLPALPELLPGSEITFTEPVKGVIPTFFNTAHITIDPVSVTGNIDPATAQVTGSSRFTALSWPGLAALLLLLLVGLRYLVRWRRRRNASGPAGWNDGGTRPPGPAPDGGAPPRERDPVGTAYRTASAGRRRTVLAGLLGGGLALLAVAGPLAGPAAAADGSLTFLPGKGTAATPIYAVTSGPCPKQGTNIVGYMYGSGFPKEGAVVMANQDAPVRHDGAFGFGLRDNLQSIAAEVGATLQGDYRIVVKCIDALNLTTYSQFTGTISFSSPTSFSAPVPAKPPVAGVPPGYLALVFPQFKTVVAQDFAAAQADNQDALAQKSAGPTAAAGPTKAPPTGTAAAQAGADQRSGGNPIKGLGWSPLGVLALLAVVAAALYLWTRRPAGATAGPAGAAGKDETRSKVLWPDDGDR